MGVYSGDVVVPSFPAITQLAVYLEYVPDSEESGELTFAFQILLNENEIAKGQANAKIVIGEPTIIVVPRGLINFTEETQFRFLMTIHDKPETELLSKKITLPPTA